ncbi:MAG: hypothetical protein ACTSSA_11795 [Candidatus Freyarchaeota archaeon]
MLDIFLEPRGYRRRARQDDRETSSNENTPAHTGIPSATAVRTPHATTDMNRPKYTPGPVTPLRPTPPQPFPPDVKTLTAAKTATNAKCK